MSWLGITDARRRRPPTNELTALGPTGDVLVVRGVVPSDERDVHDIDPEQVESAGLGLPTDLRGGDVRVSLLELKVVFINRTASNLVLAAPPVPRRHDAVNEESVVSSEIESLAGPQAHREPQVTVPEQRLDWAQPRCPV